MTKQMMERWCDEKTNDGVMKQTNVPMTLSINPENKKPRTLFKINTKPMK